MQYVSAPYEIIEETVGTRAINVPVPTPYYRFLKNLAKRHMYCRFTDQLFCSADYVPSETAMEIEQCFHAAGVNVDVSMVAYLTTLDPADRACQIAIFRRVFDELSGLDVPVALLNDEFNEPIKPHEPSVLFAAPSLPIMHDGPGPANVIHLHPDHGAPAPHKNAPTITAVSVETVIELCQQILRSKDSVTKDDLELIRLFWPLIPTKEQRDSLIFDCPLEGVTRAEIRAFFVAMLIKTRSVEYESVMDQLTLNCTDVMRIADWLSDFHRIDNGIPHNNKFCGISTQMKKRLAWLIEQNFVMEDLYRDVERWKRLFHTIHVHKYIDETPVGKQIRDFRDPAVRYVTFQGKIEKAIASGNIYAAVHMLKKNPAMLIRRFNELLKKSSTERDQELIATKATEALEHVPTNTILQFEKFLLRAGAGVPRFVTYSRPGRGTEVTQLDAVSNYTPEFIEFMVTHITDVLVKRFAELPPLGKVYIDPIVRECPLPTKMNTVIPGKLCLPRGYRIPIPDVDIMRFFIWWKGCDDVDLSVRFYNEDFSKMTTLNYNSHPLVLEGEDGVAMAAHSGDITKGYKGAMEYIDIVTAAVAAEYRYVIPYVNVYTGPNFSNIPESFFGWAQMDMETIKLELDPYTVIDKVDMTEDIKGYFPIVIDLQERCVVVANLAHNADAHTNINTASGKTQLVSEILDVAKYSNLGTLLERHAKARGELVDTPEEADYIVAPGAGVDSEGLDPTDYLKINSEFIK